MISTTSKVRIGFIFILFCFFYCLLLGNLYRIQIRQSSFFKAMGEKQYQVSVVQRPPRGIIYDRHETPIALNKKTYSAFLLPHKITPEHTRLMQFLKNNYPQAYDRLQKKKNKYFMYIKRKISEKEKALIEKEQIEGIYFLQEPSRFYPYKHMSTVIGLTDIDNQGLFGIEHLFNTCLAGEPSRYLLEKDARSGTFYFEKETEKEGKRSEPLRLTIDSELQFIAQREIQKTVKKFGSQEGCAIILDPTNGHILALAQYPNLDPDMEIGDMSKTKNRCITDAYELGSVMKIMVALAAFEEGVVSPDELIDCENTTTTSINGMKFTTVHPNGIIPFAEVIEHSNNIGMVKVALRMGTKLAEYYNKFGFGKKTGIELSGEQDGFVNPPAKWSKRSIISYSFGYEMTSTLLQLAQAFAMIAQDGKRVHPTLLYEKNGATDEQVITPETVALIRPILKNTVEKGTAKKALVQGYSVFGKTGTAKMLIDGSYSDKHNLFSFAGIVEKGSYKRVIVTFVKDSRQQHHIYAAQVTAPLFGAIAEKMVIHERAM